MHEASIAQALLDTILTALREQTPADRPHRITRIVVAAGVLAGVEGECLGAYFEQLIPGTPAEGAVLEVKMHPARLVCRECKTAVAYDGLGPVALRCAACGGPNGLEGGYELFVESLETEEIVQ